MKRINEIELTLSFNGSLYTESLYFDDEPLTRQELFDIGFEGDVSIGDELYHVDAANPEYYEGDTVVSGLAFTVTAGKDSHKTDIRVVAWKAINRRKDKMNAEICWRRASAGTKLSGDSLIKYDADPDARLGRCMIHDGWYIPTSEIVKYIK